MNGWKVSTAKALFHWFCTSETRWWILKHLLRKLTEDSNHRKPSCAYTHSNRMFVRSLGTYEFSIFSLLAFCLIRTLRKPEPLWKRKSCDYLGSSSGMGFFVSALDKWLRTPGRWRCRLRSKWRTKPPRRAFLGVLHKGREQLLILTPLSYNR